jgi:hypothetical protein
MSARRISFVGISMHPFMNIAFEFLFHGKAPVEVVVANVDNRDVSGAKPTGPNSWSNLPDPLCSAGKIERFLNRNSRSRDFKVRMVYSFGTFIAEEMR